MDDGTPSIQTHTLFVGAFASSSTINIITSFHFAKLHSDMQMLIYYLTNHQLVQW
jgi:hypothetical protein